MPPLTTTTRVQPPDTPSRVAVRTPHTTSAFISRPRTLTSRRGRGPPTRAPRRSAYVQVARGVMCDVRCAMSRAHRGPLTTRKPPQVTTLNRPIGRPRELEIECRIHIHIHIDSERTPARREGRGGAAGAGEARDCSRRVRDSRVSGEAHRRRRREVAKPPGS